MADGSLFSPDQDLKRCSARGELKPRTAFGRKTAKCKPCRSRQTIEWQQTNPEKYREKQRRYYASEKPRFRAYGKDAWKRMAPEAKARKLARAKIRYLEQKYGLSKEEWDRLYAAQGGVCALCRIPGRLGRHGKLAVDHDHETGRVRGLLCGPCNVALGLLGDTAAKFERVMSYLRGEAIEI
jgi:hypothetical protein